MANDDEAMMDFREYLGDDVYASFDGERIWLRKTDGNKIALTLHAFQALVNYPTRGIAQ